MKVKINNKIFDVTVGSDKTIILGTGLNEGDLLFFTQWMNKTTKSSDTPLPHQYKKDLHFVTDETRGILNGCFPISITSEKINKVEMSYETIRNQ